VLAAGPAAAAVTLQFTGTYTPDGLFPIDADGPGDIRPLSGTLTYDPAAAEDGPAATADSRFYDDPTASFTLDFQEDTLATSLAPLRLVSRDTVFGGPAFGVVRSLSGPSSATANATTGAFGPVQISLVFNLQDAVAALALPDTLTPASFRVDDDGSLGRGSITIDGLGGLGLSSFRLTGVTVVPEPATAGVFGVGALTLITRRRRA